MQHLDKFIETQIDEGFVSDILNFIGNFFGINRWLYSHNTGLFSRNRFGNNPYYNIMDPRKRARIKKDRERREKQRQKERQKQQQANNKLLTKKTNDKGTDQYVKTGSAQDMQMSINFLVNLINKSNYCMLYNPNKKSPLVTFDWLSKNSDEKDEKFIPSAWFTKNVKKFDKNDEFLAVKGSEDKPYFSVLDCVFRGNDIILPWDNNELDENENEEDVINSELIIPASYFANNDIAGFKKYIKASKE